MYIYIHAHVYDPYINTYHAHLLQTHYYRTTVPQMHKALTTSQLTHVRTPSHTTQYHKCTHHLSPSYTTHILHIPNKSNHTHTHNTNIIHIKITVQTYTTTHCMLSGIYTSHAQTHITYSTYTQKRYILPTQSTNTVISYIPHRTCIP